MRSATIKILSLVAASLLSVTVSGQDYGAFTEDHFPAHLIDTAIVAKRQLGDELIMLRDSCNWSKRAGKKIDVFWMRTNTGDFFGHVYEYFLDCDNLRLIYWQTDPGGRGAIVDFMIEPLESESMFVVAKRRHLKNKKQYQPLLAKPSGQ